MNLTGSYRALQSNSKAAIVAAIEIYNKPQFSYRDECCIILLANAWELLLKAVLSKNKVRIFYPKLKGQSYRTLSLNDALKEAERYFPKSVEFAPVAANIKLIARYRNDTIHFYNRNSLSIILFGLIQTCLVNYKDIVIEVFGYDISREVNIQLLPLSFGVQPDPIHFLQKAKDNPPKSKEVADFLSEISVTTQELESSSLDTARFLTNFSVSLSSVKKISTADVVVGIDKDASAHTPTVVERKVNPNDSHEENQASIIEKVGKDLNGTSFNTFTFQALVWKLGIKDKAHLCWRARNGAATWYAKEVVSIIKRLPKHEIEAAIKEYKTHQKAERIQRKLRYQTS